MYRSNYFIVLFTCFLLALSFEGILLGKGKEDKVIVVNCTAGDSINRALEKNDDETAIEIEISGTCTENVVIRRDNVILRGSDPELDGIQAVEEGRGAVVTVRDSFSVTMENLALTGGDLGLLLLNSNADRPGVLLFNCLIEGNKMGAGIVDSFLAANQTRFMGNADGGLFLADGSLLDCGACTFDNGGNWEVDLRGFSRGNLNECTLSGRAKAQDSSKLVLVRSTLEDRLHVVGNSLAIVTLGSLGHFFGAQKSIIQLRGTEQVNPGPQPQVSKLDIDSFLSVESILVPSGDGNSTEWVHTHLSGNIHLHNYSKGVISPDSDNDGEIFCHSGSDFFCPVPGQIDCAGCVSCPPE